MMKNIFPAAFILIAMQAPFPGNAQDQLPDVKEIRAMISGEIESFHIAPKAIFKEENRKVWNGSDSIPVRIYYPSSEKNLRVIYNIHGGAFVACDLDTHENVSIELANRTHSVVVAVDYRKPPEFPFPASFNDCKTVLQWIRLNALGIHGNANDIVLTGDSGGGLQAMALAADLKGKLGVRAICLINPAADLRTPSAGFYTLVTNWYLNGHDASDSLVSPITATDFHGLPPTLVITSETDELKPHGVAILEKLKSSGVQTSSFEVKGEDHLGGLWAGAHPRAAPALDETVRFINALK